MSAGTMRSSSGSSHRWNRRREDERAGDGKHQRGRNMIHLLSLCLFHEHLGSIPGSGAKNKKKLADTNLRCYNLHQAPVAGPGHVLGRFAWYLSRTPWLTRRRRAPMTTAPMSLIVALVLSAWSVPLDRAAAADSVVKIGDPVPSFTLKDIHFLPRTLDEFPKPKA